MKKTITALIALAAFASSVSPLLAKGPDHCPPGLAKKSPACVPPGLAKKKKAEDSEHWKYRRYDGDDYGEYRRGDRIPEGYELVLVPKDYGLPKPDDGTEYYVVDDVIFEVSKETREIIDLYRAVDAVFN